MYFVYIIFSPTKNKYYVGSSEHVEERLKKHNTNHKGFTGGMLDWELKWTEEHPDKSSAIKRENQIKAWKSRKMIEKLINGV
jgi:putative endonuclease